MNDTNGTVNQALSWLKRLIKWPEVGVKDFSGFWAYLKGNWQTLLFVFIGLLVAFWVIKKIISWIINLLKG